MNITPAFRKARRVYDRRPQEADTDVGGSGGKTHRSLRYEYTNIQAPAVVQWPFFLQTDCLMTLTPGPSDQIVAHSENGRALGVVLLDREVPF